MRARPVDVSDVYLFLLEEQQHFVPCLLQDRTIFFALQRLQYVFCISCIMDVYVRGHGPIVSQNV